MYTQLTPEQHGYVVAHYPAGYRVTTRGCTPVTEMRPTREAAVRDFRDMLGRARERSC